MYANIGKFIIDKLIETQWYDSIDEIKAETVNALSNLKYDMENGDTLWEAFDKACRDLHITTDNIESYM